MLSACLHEEMRRARRLIIPRPLTIQVPAAAGAAVLTREGSPRRSRPNWKRNPLWSPIVR